METKTQYYDIVESTLESYTKELAFYLLDGWAISKTNPGDVVGFYGGTFTVSLYRDADSVAKYKSKAADTADVARPDRATILAKAREAKAAKKAEATQT